MARILFTSFYKDRNPVRQEELDVCMIMNTNNKHIDKIYVFLEGDIKDFSILQNHKIVVINASRPTYQDFFNKANEVCGECDHAIIANTDIIFDETIMRIDGMKPNECYALSRYHYFSKDKIVLHNEQYSQDVWVFKGKIKKMAYADFYMGIRGCDNRIAYEIHKAGYLISNPAFDIKTIHYHMSESRNYGLEAVAKPYLPVPVCYLK